jgi:hypothetical protein
MPARPAAGAFGKGAAMIVTVVNLSKHIEDDELQQVIRAINRQIREDFEPCWSIRAELRLEGKSTKDPDRVSLPELRGDAVLYLWDKIDLPGAEGYHQANARGIPYGLVFTELSKQLAEDWTVTLSHEALELIGDPQVNLLVAGPHPEENRTVFHWFEMSDPVQDESYVIDSVKVSNFVLPLYYTPHAEAGSRNDFLGRAHAGKTLASFGINPGGYIGFFDPKTNKDVTFANSGDEKAMHRLKVKKKHAVGRRALRIAQWPHEAATEGSRTARGLVTAVAARTGKRYTQID